MMFISTLFLLLVTVPVVATEYTLVWSDEFDGPAINMSAWNFEAHCQPANDEKECYTTENAEIVDGVLVVTARKEAQNYVVPQDVCTAGDKANGCSGSPYTSARMTTWKAGLAWTYGRFEIRAKMPAGNGLWPALWFLPQTSVYGGWATGGEIDLIETKGNDPHSISNALNYGAPWPRNAAVWQWSKFDEDLSADFHVYTLEWTSEELRFYMDDKETWSIGTRSRNWWTGDGPSPFTDSNQPWDQPFYFILNIAIGGHFFDPPFTDADLPTWTQPTMQLDYIRVYQDTATPAAGKQAKHHTVAAEKPKSASLSTGAIIGISVGAAGLVVIAATVVAIFIVRKQFRLRNEPAVVAVDMTNIEPATDI